MSAAAVAPKSALPSTRHCDSEERGDLEDGDDQCCSCGCLPAGLFNESLLIKNEGSTGELHIALRRLSSLTDHSSPRLPRSRAQLPQLAPLVFNIGSDQCGDALAVPIRRADDGARLRARFGDPSELDTLERVSISLTLFVVPQLGVLFFVAAGASLVVGVGGHFSHDRKMRGHSGFVYSGRGTQLVVWSIGGLTVATCILLIVAGESRT